MKHLLDTKVGPYQAMIPMVDVDTIGAGGGSIAYVDGGGIFRVGPRSAGADPGRPRTGGAAPSHRDRRDGEPRLALAGSVPRRRDAAPRRPRPRGVRGGPAEALGCPCRRRDGRRPDPHALDGAVDRGELGAERVRPARLRPRRRGRRRAALRGPDRARGGDAVGDRPAASGRHGSAGPARDGHGLRVRLDRLPAALRARCDAVQAAFEELEEQARVQLEADGCRQEPDVRRRRLPLPRPGLRAARRRALGSIDDDWVEKVRADFHDIHEREYSRRFEESDIELPNIRVRGIGLHARARAARGRARAESPGRRCGTKARPGSGRRRARPGADALLRPLGAPGGQPPGGPAIVNQYDSTTVIPPGISAHVDRYGNIVVEVGASAEAQAIAAGMEVTA